MSPISIYCPFCHQHTAVGAVITQANTSSACTVNGESWWIGKCHACHHAMLCCKDGTIYPTPRPEPTAPQIPKPIAADLDEAKVCFVNECYRACAVMARRCLEAACVEKGGAGRTLMHKIEDLRSKGSITADLEEWAHTLRLIGNDAAHDLTATVEKEDATDLLELATQFLQVVFVAPAIASARRAARGIT